MEETQLKTMRRDYGIQGWALLAYVGIMNAAVMLPVGLMSIYLTFTALIEGNEPNVETMTAQILDASGWGYLLAIVIGAVVLLLWKKPQFCFGTVWERGKTMTVGSFFAILSLFMSAQLISQLGITGVEALLNLFDLSMDAYLESVSVSTDGLSMFLYVGLGAPISEEILFRGLVLRSMESHGKRFAIVASALLFGLFHGNLIQAPFAFLVGLVLGYVTVEYNIGWAMALHMFNNLIIADTMTRLLSDLPASVSDMIFWVLMALFTAAAVVALVIKRDQVVEYFKREKIDPLCAKAFFTAPGIIVLLIVLLLTVAFSFAAVFML